MRVCCGLARACSALTIAALRLGGAARSRAAGDMKGAAAGAVKCCGRRPSSGRTTAVAAAAAALVVVPLLRGEGDWVVIGRR